MSTFKERIVELLQYPEDIVAGEAEAFLAQSAGWSVQTEVPLSRIAYLVAALLSEPDPHERRLMVEDKINMRDA